MASEGKMASEGAPEIQNGAVDSDGHDSLAEEVEFKDVDISENSNENSSNAKGSIPDEVSPDAVSPVAVSPIARTSSFEYRPTATLSRSLSPIAPAQPVPSVIPASKKFTVSAFKDWSKTALKCTKQVLSERFGIGTKTVDSELEIQIESLLENRRKYQVILTQMQVMSKNFSIFIQSQKELSDTFVDLSQKIPELYQEFACNGETHKVTYKNGLALEGLLNFFISNISTLCNKTMEDTLLTVKQYEVARVEYDAFRSDFEQQRQNTQCDPVKLKEAEAKFQMHLEKFDQMRSDLSIKMKLLDENKTKVMRRNLVHLHEATTAYYTGNHLAVEEILKQYNISASDLPSSPSWLETSD